MLDYGQKRKVKSVIYHKATLIILFALVLIVLHSTWVVYNKKKISQEMKGTSLENVQALRDRDIDISSKIERLKTDQGIEEEIRAKFNVAKVNEAVVVVVESSDSSLSSTSQNTSFWQKVKNLFK